MNAPETVPLDEVVELARLNNQRLQMAARIAAGICANPGGCMGYGWQKNVAVTAWDIAGKLQSLAISGGC